jgi:hypothetical protein
MYDLSINYIVWMFPPPARRKYPQTFTINYIKIVQIFIHFILLKKFSIVNFLHIGYPERSRTYINLKKIIKTTN